MKNKLIYTIPVLSKIDTVFVKVDGDFTDFIKDKIISSYESLTKYNERFLGLEQHTFNWAFKTKNGHNLARLLKICDTLGVSREEAYRQIKGYYSWGSHNKPVRINKCLKINTFFVEGYALYIAEGDTGDSGTKKPRKLRLTNSEPSIINFFVKWLEILFSDIFFYLIAILPSQTECQNTLNQIKLNKRKIKFSKDKYNKQIKYRLCMDNAMIIDLIMSIRNEVKQIVLDDKTLACAYLRGLMAGEGTVYNNRSKYVRLEMKNPQEIDYAKKLLNKLGITFTFHRRSNRKNMESIYIGGKDNLRRYYELVGFGSHKKRQEKLKKLIEGY